MICQCCHTDKATHAFSRNTKRHAYSPNCRDCGNWLTLFRAVFGPTRDWKRNVELTVERKRLKRLRNTPANDLYAAWGIGRAA